MKKTSLVIVLAVLFLIIAAGCSAPAINQSSSPLGSSLKTQESSLSSVQISNKSSTTSPAVSSEETSSGIPDGAEIKTDSGRYICLNDGGTINVQISGVPDAVGTRTFTLSDEMIADFNGLGLIEGVNIRFEYYTNQNGEDVIVSLKKI